MFWRLSVLYSQDEYKRVTQMRHSFPLERSYLTSPTKIGLSTSASRFAYGLLQKANYSFLMSSTNWCVSNCHDYRTLPALVGKKRANFVGPCHWHGQTGFVRFFFIRPFPAQEKACACFCERVLVPYYFVIPSY